MLKVSIVFDYTNQYGSESRENIIGNVETNQNGDVEYKTILEKIKSYGFSKARVNDLKVYHFNRLIDFGEIKLVK